MKKLLPIGRTLSSAIVLLLTLQAPGNDWPQFRGPNRDAVWNETGLKQKFPAEGLKTVWKSKVGFGYSCAVIVQGKVFVPGSRLQKPKAWEEMHCLDEKTGEPLWTYTYPVTYPDWAYDPSQNCGPNATPIVDSGKIYMLGCMGNLLCLDTAKGSVVWQKNLMTEYGMKEFSGITPCPLIEKNLLIMSIGCQPNASVVAFDKDTGKEVWKALDDPFTYSSPMVLTAAGQRQLIIWTPKAVTSLNPATGQIWWREELNTTGDYGVATPVVNGDLMLISGLMFQLSTDKPGATILWPATKPMSKRIFSQTSMPWMKDGYVYSGKSAGQLVCLEARTGKQIWEDTTITSKQQGATIHLTSNGDTVLLFTDQGNLIRAKLTPEGYTEISRAHLVDPTQPFAGRKLTWPPPAYANQHVFVHNGDELVCVSLAEAE